MIPKEKSQNNGDNLMYLLLAVLIALDWKSVCKQGELFVSEAFEKAPKHKGCSEPEPH